MWKLLKLNFFGEKRLKNHSGIVGTLIITISILIFFAAIMALTNSTESGYTGTTDKCISCHNDSTYPNDTNGDGVPAPYKRPHNNNVMCEKCHESNPHEIVFIQSDGKYGSKSTAGSCPECHQTGIPTENNSNFSTAFMIYSPLRHSSNIQNGSAFGNYWTNTSPKSACIFCHNKTLHNVTPLGRILEFSPDYVINTSIGANFTCSKCHYKGDANWSIMNASFAAAGLETPPEITNGTNWNGRYLNYFNHSFNHSMENYNDTKCKECHGIFLSTNATMSEFVHNVEFGNLTKCIECHSTPRGKYPAIDMLSFGKHNNINTADGNDTLSNSDCWGCHYNITNDMFNQTLDVEIRKCIDCHIEGNFSAPIIKNHKPPKVNISTGGNVSTTAYCSICHNNSINKYIYSINASISHYGTTTSLVKTVNQTSKPRFGFMTSGDAQQYNKECNNCHNPSNSSYGNATLITTGHIGRATCNECHVKGNASDLHNNSLGLPLTFTCISCHTTYADKYGAPNLSGLPKADWSTCNGGSCHTTSISGSLDTLARHNIDLTKAGTGGSTDTVYLNNQPSIITVTKGALVNITSRVNDAAGIASKVGGAEYYIDSPDPGQGKGIPMNALDGYYDAVNGNWESVNATIDTSSLSNGTHTIFVRGMDIGKQWSATKNATLVVESYGYINGTVTNGTSPIPGAIVSTTGANNTTDANGNYSFRLHDGNYTVETSKLPEYYGNSSSGIVVTSMNTTILNIVLEEKQKGTITGTVSVTG